MTTTHWGFPGGRRFKGNMATQPVDCVINNGIQSKPTKQSAIPKLAEMRLKYDQIYVCSSNWHPQKRLDANVALFKHLQQKHPNSCLIVMGDHPDTRLAN